MIVWRLIARSEREMLTAQCALCNDVYETPAYYLKIGWDDAYSVSARASLIRRGIERVRPSIAQSSQASSSKNPQEIRSDRTGRDPHFRVDVVFQGAHLLAHDGGQGEIYCTVGTRYLVFSKTPIERKPKTAPKQWNLFEHRKAER